MDNTARSGLSRELRPIFDLEIELGNRVAFVAEPAGTSCPYAVSFEQPLHLSEISTRLSLPETIKYWECRDTHYAVEAGFYSETSSHSIAGPINIHE